MIQTQSLPNERDSITHKFRVDQVKVYLTVGHYSNGQPGELFIRTTKTGTLARGLFSVLSLVISIALQHGVPLIKLLDKLENIRFEPSGLTGNPEIPVASSIIDYVAKWLRRRYVRPTVDPETSAPAGH